MPIAPPVTIADWASMGQLERLDDSKLFAEMQAARAEYQRLTAVYDRELQAAHHAHHSTETFMKHLMTANDMGLDILEALNRYQSAVARLVEFYKSKLA